jgi:hypothetical protein
MLARGRRGSRVQVETLTHSDLIAATPLRGWTRLSACGSSEEGGLLDAWDWSAPADGSIFGRLAGGVLESFKGAEGSAE